MVVVDTDFVIDAANDDQRALEVTDVLDRQRLVQRVSAITLFELNTGLILADQPDQERQLILSVVESKDVVPADKAVMSKAGRWYARLQKRGERLGERDCIIAATALLRDEPVVTRNTKHFDRFDNLEILKY